MRPSTSNPGLEPISRKQDPHTSQPAAGGAITTFFLASESALSAAQDSAQGSTGSSPRIPAVEEKNNGGIREPQELAEQEVSTNVIAGRRISAIRQESCSKRERSCDSLGGLSRAESMSRPLTPVSHASAILGSSGLNSPTSAYSRSFRHSEDESTDERPDPVKAFDIEEEGKENAPDPFQAGVASQFIMPSILMPSRRPFTDRGKVLGKLKVLVVGKAGTGKTSLIKSIVQSCEDVVHVDPPATTLHEGRLVDLDDRTTSRHRRRSQKMVHIHASTRPYPEWWSDVEENSSRQTRKNHGDTILERNLCFIDTPGYDSGASVSEGMNCILGYVEDQMQKSLNVDKLTESEVLGILGGEGGPLVDVVLFLVTPNISTDDLDFIRRLADLTNIMILLSKADTLPAEIETLKTSIANEITQFGIDIVAPPRLNLSSLPYAVCSSPSLDLEDMDASLLMQSDFLQPLSPSDLPSLTNGLFTPDTVLFLKHSAVKKLLRYRKAVLPATDSGTISRNPTSQGVPPERELSRSPLNLTGALLSDHQIREERRARAGLAQWATNLRRALQKERTRYEEILQHERADWLKARLTECDGEEKDSLEKELGSEDISSRSQSRMKEAYWATSRVGMLDQADPLGILRWGESLRRKGWTVLKLISGCGIVGALGFLTLRNLMPGGENWSLSAGWLDGTD